MKEKPRILIVDDEPEILDCLRRTLSSSGYDLTFAEHAKQAIGLLAEGSFDLLLSDVNMPEIDGHAVMKQARSLQPTMIRVFLTGAGTMESAVRAINEGEVHRFVPKPFGAGDLRQLVREALERKSELDVASQVSSRASQRRQLYEHLEAEHPGITEFSLDDSGAYVLETPALEQMAEAIGLLPGLGK